MSDIFDVPKVLRFHAQPERIFDHSNDTVLVTRTLLTNTADEIDRLRSQVERQPLMVIALNEARAELHSTWRAAMSKARFEAHPTIKAIDAALSSDERA